MSTPKQVQELSAKIEEHYQAAEDSQTGTTEPADTTQATQEPAAVETAAPETPAEDYKQKYLVLQGKYNAEVPRLHQVVREQQARTQNLEQLLSAMQQRANAPQQPPEQQFVTEDDKDAYGDTIDVMRRVCRDEISGLQQQIAAIGGMVRQMTSSVVPRMNEVQQRQARTDESMFWNNLTAAVPNWRQINDDQRFKDWLLEFDPMTGTTKQTLLEIAHKNLDVNRVASFFSTWMAMNGGNQQKETPRQVSQLEAQIAPGRGRSAAPPTPQGGVTPISKDEVAKFYDDVRKGKYKGRDADRSRIEHAIFLASREGAIQ